jgi:hypothetical protein
MYSVHVCVSKTKHRQKTKDKKQKTKDKRQKTKNKKQKIKDKRKHRQKFCICIPHAFAENNSLAIAEIQIQAKHTKIQKIAFFNLITYR